MQTNLKRMPDSSEFSVPNMKLITHVRQSVLQYTELKTRSFSNPVFKVLRHTSHQRERNAL